MLTLWDDYVVWKCIHVSCRWCIILIVGIKTHTGVSRGSRCAVLTKCFNNINALYNTGCKSSDWNLNHLFLFMEKPRSTTYEIDVSRLLYRPFRALRFYKLSLAHLYKQNRKWFSGYILIRPEIIILILMNWKMLWSSFIKIKWFCS